ncbi:MAG: hypothetical protein V1793_05720 [Pseudomonadota bacterium]
MYALIYDEHRPERPQKRVISVHATREESDRALEQRWDTKGKRVWECNARIVWVDKAVKSGDTVGPGEYDTWRPGEAVPQGELIDDCD